MKKTKKKAVGFLKAEVYLDQDRNAIVGRGGLHISKLSTSEVVCLLLTLVDKHLREEYVDKKQYTHALHAYKLFHESALHLVHEFIKEHGIKTLKEIHKKS